MTIKQAGAIAYIVAAVNTFLEVSGEHYRVTPDDLVTTTRDGHMLIALKTTNDAADWRHCERPYTTMQ